MSNQCLCSLGQYWNGTWCVNYAIYSDSCTSESQCNPYDAYLICGIPPLGTSQKVCYCQTGYYYDDYLTRCISRKLPYQNCTQTYECINDAYCVTESVYSASKSCQCIPGYYFDKSTSSCVALLTFGGICTSTACNNNFGLYCLLNTNTYKCSCLPDFFWNGNKCQLTYAYGETCTSNSYSANSCRASRNLNCNPLTLVCECAYSKF